MKTLEIAHYIRFSNERTDPYMHSYVELKFGDKPMRLEGEVVEFPLLQQALARPGRYMIFNCSCGIPECAGRLQGVEVKHEGDEIEFDDLDARRKWRFDLETIRLQVSAVLLADKQAAGYFKERDIPFYGLNLDSFGKAY